MKRGLIAALLLSVCAAIVHGQGNSNVATTVQPGVQTNVEYAAHDGVPLVGDFRYSPCERRATSRDGFYSRRRLRARGSKAGYATTWGPYLAARGYVVFAIDYRLSTPTQPTWPQALLDCKAAIQYLRGKASALGIDPERIGVGGDSAGATLAAVVGATQDFPEFANRYPKDAFAAASTKVKVVVPIYGVYDMMAWQKYTSSQPNNNKPLEQFIGGAPQQMPGAYFESSALSYIREAATSLGSVATSNPGAKVAWFFGLGHGGPGCCPPKANPSCSRRLFAMPAPRSPRCQFPTPTISGSRSARSPARRACPIVRIILPRNSVATGRRRTISYFPSCSIFFRPICRNSQ